MVTRRDTRPQTHREAQSMPSNVDLGTLELHDVSDLRSDDDRPNRLLRWVVAADTICYSACNPLDVAPIVRAGIGHMSKALA
jgi:hypothetical protein